MVSKWLGHYDILATFGKQANMYLQDVRNLRASRYFAAHPFSTISWGTSILGMSNEVLLDSTSSKSTGHYYQQ